LQREIKECGTILEQQLGHPIDTFAYPHGGREHIGEQGPRVVQQTGYAWAMTTLPGFNTPESDPYLLRRFSADARLHWLIIATMTSGLWSFLSRLYTIATRCMRFLTSL
jgi:peptidoglycan/xylan/chitin deacetylase (PgdA/CDA1 family)